jgi:hypothetical protein
VRSVLTVNSLYILEWVTEASYLGPSHSVALLGIPGTSWCTANLLYSEEADGREGGGGRLGILHGHSWLTYGHIFSFWENSRAPKTACGTASKTLHGKLASYLRQKKAKQGKASSPQNNNKPHFAHTFQDGNTVIYNAQMEAEFSSRESFSRRWPKISKIYWVTS